MSPAEIRMMGTSAIVEMLVNLRPGDQAVAWLASVIADPDKMSAINELSCRYATRGGRVRLPRAKSAETITVDGAKFKHLLWLNRVKMGQIGPMIGKCGGWGSVTACKGRMSYWAADAIATELGMHVDAFIEAVATPEELQRLTA